MHLQVVIGHGTFCKSNGMFRIPNNVQLEFFSKEGQGLSDDVANSFERILRAEDGPFSTGISEDQRKKISRMHTEIIPHEKYKGGDSIPNYKLESVENTTHGIAYKDALADHINIWTPGKESGDSTETAFLQDIILKLVDELGKPDGTEIRIQWLACRTHIDRASEEIKPDDIQ